MEVVITDMDYEVDYFEGKTRKILVLGSGGQVGHILPSISGVLMLKSWSLILLMVLIRT